MKKIVFLLILVNASLILALGIGYYLAETYPFQAGSPFFGVQSFAEESRIALSQEPMHRVEMRFELVERRLTDLAMSSNHDKIPPFLEAFDDALTKAAASLEELPPEKQAELYHELQGLLARIDLVIAGVSPIDIGLLSDVEEKVASLHQTVSQFADIDSPAESNEGRLSIGLLIPFLRKSYDHGDFPMDGGHTTENCLACHADGTYANTPSDCETCHSLNETASSDQNYAFQMLNPLYPDHFDGECSDCHSTSSWYPDDFNHVGVWECNSCHTEDLPSLAAIRELTSQFADQTVVLYPDSQTLFTSFDPNDFIADSEDRHYPGNCKTCHTDTTDWQIAAYSHEILRTDSDLTDAPANLGDHKIVRVVQNCGNCHSVDANFSATGHGTVYESDCTACHKDTLAWQEINFDHTGYTDCATCHPIENIGWHYPGECADCHLPQNWGITQYEHDSQTACNLCHAKPAAHYPGTCTTCHTPLDWYMSIYEHQPGSDCTSCHTAPVGHSTDQCSSCHSTSSWIDNAIYHALQTCAMCHTQPNGHYPGTCTLCHQTKEWLVDNVDHTTLTECTACHMLQEELGAHYPGQCSKCHNTTSWQEAIFNHEGLTECTDCHTTPQDHYAGTCTSCHTSTSDWYNTAFDHTNLNECLNCHTTPEGHYPGTCSQCHTTQSWDFIGYNHSIVDKCTGCHVAPEGHWPGQCSNCHTVSTWFTINFDHTSYSDCKSCHLRPTGHPRGQCSNCHVTESWTIILTKTPATTTETPEVTETPVAPDTTEDPSLTVTPEP